jgi:hypothetical protein
MEIGKKIWAIADGYIPSLSHGPGPIVDKPEREFISHETACILNATDKEATIELTIFFSDKEPLGPYKIKVGARRTNHFRFNDLKNPSIPFDTDYSSIFISDVPVVIQHTRLDTRQAENALLSTIAFSA